MPAEGKIDVHVHHIPPAYRRAAEAVDITRAALNLVFSHTLERFPRIRFILSHGGGVLPFVAWRIANSPSFPGWDPDHIWTLLRRFWIDTALSCAPSAIASWKEAIPLDQVVFGSDWPFAPPKKVAREVALVEGSALLTKDEITRIARTNALTLFPRFGA